MTRKLMLIASAATMALAAPATAGPGGHGPQQHADRQQARGGGGGQKVQRQQAQRATMQRAERAPQKQRIERAPRMQRAERAPQQRMQRTERQRVQRAPSHLERQRPTRTVERQTRPTRIERQAQRPARTVERQLKRPDRMMSQRVDRARPQQDRMIARQAERADRRLTHEANRLDARHVVQATPAMREFSQRVAARANMRQELRRNARDQFKVGQRIDPVWAQQASYMPLRYASQYQDTPDWTYRYDGDRLYRVNRSTGIIGGIIPLLGGAYSVGRPMPGYYSSSYVPLGYRSLYYDTPDYYYRYGDGGLYQVNASSGLITALVSLLTGTNLGIGQTLPYQYSTYNVPYAYRSQYYDTNDAWYRYNNGYIYQVDPYTRMIRSSYPVYGNGYYDVGQPWPVAYPSYNVPNYYQSTYYDTPQWDYRYANGAIYQVNPQTQLINALVSLVSGQPLGVGQMMPAGYGVYNVPLNYRSQYYDTADNWYRYGDGNIYRVDPYSGRIAEVIPTYV